MTNPYKPYIHLFLDIILDVPYLEQKDWLLRNVFQLPYSKTYRAWEGNYAGKICPDPYEQGIDRIYSYMKYGNIWEDDY